MEVVKKKDVRCDRCFNLHLKCNRILPQCNQCIKSNNSVCSYTRSYQRQRQNIQQHYKQHVVVLKLPQQVSTPGPLYYIYRSSDRSMLSRVMTFLQYPHLGSNSKYTKFIWERIVRDRPNIQPLKIDQQGRELDFSANGFFAIMDLGIDGYFTHVNPGLDLLEQSMFQPYSRPAFLTLAVVASGLRFKPKNDTIKPLQATLYKWLTKATSPSSLKVSLGSLQALVIIMVGLMGEGWVMNRLTYLRARALQIAYSLGCHEIANSTNKNPTSIIQRELRAAYSALRYNLAYAGLLMMPFSLEPSSSITQIYSIKKGMGFNKVYSMYLAGLIPIIHDIQTTKDLLVDGDGNLPSGFVSTINKKLADFALPILTQLYQLQIIESKVSTPATWIIKAISIINFIHAYYTFFILSMSLYETTNHLVGLNKNHNRDRDVVTHCCIKMVRFGMKVRKQDIDWYIISKFSQGAIYLAGASSSDPKLQDDLDLAITQINYWNASNNYTFNLWSNMKFLNPLDKKTCGK